MIQTRIKAEIDEYCATAYDDGPRKHLGASLIGRECLRELWYVFRWCKHKKHDGRQQRLFNRGHREESRFIEWLKGIGCETWNETPEGSQYRINGVMGHFGGSLDGIVKLPARYNLPDDCAAFLNEFKTSGTGAKFANLLKNGVKVEKPEHYAQMCTYGRKYGFKWALYMCINKNDDDLHVELVKLDWKFGEELERKAEIIIMAQDPPAKISQSAAMFQCKFCDMAGICHGGEPIDRNCRSCANAKPIENGEWSCLEWGATIPADAIPNACPKYAPIA